MHLCFESPPFFSNQPRETARVMPFWVFLVLIRNARIQELVYTHLPRFPRFYRILMLPKWFEHSKYFFLWFMFVTKSIFEFRVYFFILCIEIAQPTHYTTKIPLITIYFCFRVIKFKVFLPFFMFLILNSKFRNLTSRLPCFPGRGNGKGAVPTIFHYFLGWTWPPQPLRTSKKKLGGGQNFLKMVPENAHFSVFESRKQDSESRFRDSITSGISRVSK